jgi:hypothetical protein
MPYYVQQGYMQVSYVPQEGYTVGGPGTGNQDETSTNFTVTKTGGAEFDGTETITLSDFGGGGTFTVSLGASGAGPLTVTPPSGTSFTFTYTPITPGLKTLGFTNAQGWTNPSSLEYRVIRTVPLLSRGPLPGLSGLSGLSGY